MNSNFHKVIVIVVLLLLNLSCTTAQKRILDKPIVFNQERIALSLEYLRDRYGLNMSEPTIEPKMIVVHWTVYPTLEQAFEAFYSPQLPNYRPDIKDMSALNVSSHFMVDRDGTIYRLMPENLMARHVIGLNHCAIGIENVGGTDKNPLTRAQLDSNIWLIDYLTEKYSIDYLIGHYEYTNFEAHKLWLEKEESYRTEKEDPGEDFMKDIRVATRKQNFKPVPKKTDR